MYDGNIVHIFVDGTETGQWKTSGQSINQASAPLMIGSSTYENELFIGDVDQVGIEGIATTAFPYGRVSVDPSAEASIGYRVAPAIQTAVLISRSMRQLHQVKPLP